MRKKLKAIWYHLARLMCCLFFRVFFRVRVYGKENIPRKGPFLLISNHQSYLDPVLCGMRVSKQLCFLARDSLFANRFFGSVIRSVNTIPVKRGSADVSAMRKIISRLREGYSVCLFPEGTRTSDGRVADFRPGFGLLSRRSGAPIVPMVIDGAFECWPRNKKFFSPWCEIDVCYGKCISADEVDKMSDRKLAESLTQTVRRMQTELRTRRGKEPFKY